MTAPARIDEVLIQPGPVPQYVGWFVRGDLLESGDAEEVKSDVHVNVVLAWVHVIGSGDAPVPVTPDGELRAANDVLFYTASTPEEARMNTEVVALTMWQTKRQRPRLL